jgi:hypothetical protein
MLEPIPSGKPALDSSRAVEDGRTGRRYREAASLGEVGFQGNVIKLHVESLMHGGCRVVSI